MPTAAPLETARLVPGASQDDRLAAAPVEVLDEVDSTNDELVRRLTGPDAPPHLSALLTEHQASGRGRRERIWTTPPRSAAIVSFAVRPMREGAAAPRLPADSLHWATFLLALAGAHSIREVTGVEAGLKWPNDILIGGRKVAGILARVAPDASGHPCVVVGMGINANIPAEDLPVPTATSLLTEAGAPVDRTALLAGIIAEFRASVDRFEAVVGDPTRPDSTGRSLVDRVRDRLDSLGRWVRVELVGTAEPLIGLAEDIDDDGALIVRGEDGRRQTVSVGDVVHLRPLNGSWVDDPGTGSEAA